MPVLTLVRWQQRLRAECEATDLPCDLQVIVDLGSVPLPNSAIVVMMSVVRILVAGDAAEIPVATKAFSMRSVSRLLPIPR
eukprot:1723949-Amphidinium_carterae.1